jgi:hypothetical protein
MPEPRVLDRIPLWRGAAMFADVLEGPLTVLAPDEVFVFGSNSTGFHGAGAAGLACRGTALNTWRRDPWFLHAKAAPAGSPARVGVWATFGVARGLQSGTRGRSYAVQTIVHPGRHRSTTRREIYHQLVALSRLARACPDQRFVVTPLAEGYSGYSRDEMGEVWRELHSRHGIPATFRFIRLGREGSADLT